MQDAAYTRLRTGTLSRRRRSSGQSLIESCIVVAVVAFVLFGLLDVSRLFVHQEILDYAATAGARAQSVGFNDFMVRKVVRVASIPNAGRLENPDYDYESGLDRSQRPGEVWDDAVRSTPGSAQYEVERSRIPLYLAARWEGELAPILEYERWDDIDLFRLVNGVVTRQDVPLIYPFARALYDEDEVTLRGRQIIDTHYPEYLQE